MMLTFKIECRDCKYDNNGECNHPHGLYCEHSELWTPKWFDEKEREE